MVLVSCRPRYSILVIGSSLIVFSKVPISRDAEWRV